MITYTLTLCFMATLSNHFGQFSFWEISARRLVTTRQAGVGQRATMDSATIHPRDEPITGLCVCVCRGVIAAPTSPKRERESANCKLCPFFCVMWGALRSLLLQYLPPFSDRTATNTPPFSRCSLLCFFDSQPWCTAAKTFARPNWLYKACLTLLPWGFDLHVCT